MQTGYYLESMRSAAKKIEGEWQPPELDHSFLYHLCVRECSSNLSTVSFYKNDDFCTRFLLNEIDMVPTDCDDDIKNRKAFGIGGTGMSRLQ